MGKPSPAEADLLTTQQVRELYGWSTTAINRWAKDGLLPSQHKFPGRTGPRLFDRAAVEEFRRTRETAA